MNKLHHHPADTPSCCFSYLLHCLFCGGTVSTRSTTSTPHSTSISTEFVDLLQNDETVSNLPDQQAQVPIVARLMGLETPVDMNWVPRKARVDDSFNRSKSVSSVDYLLHFDPKHTPPHRRVKTSLSFREVPVRDFLVVCLENSERNAECDKNRAEDAHKDHQEAKTDGWKNEGRRTTRDGRRASASTKSNIQVGHARQIMTARQSSSRIARNSEQKIGPSCQRSGKENSHITARKSLSNWQQKNDYYCKRQATKSHLGCSKASSKSKSKLQKDVNSDRVCVSAMRSHRRKTSTVNMSVSRKLHREERRRSRNSNIEDQGTETFGTMIRKMKRLVEKDLEMKRWNFRCDAGLGYLSLEIEVGILDGLLNQMVLDLASKWDV